MKFSKQKCSKPISPVKKLTEKFLTPGIFFMLPACFIMCQSFLIPQTIRHQDILKKWPAASVQKALHAANVKELSEEEKNTLFYVNLLRQNPPLFYQTFVLNYKDSLQIKDKNYLNSLKTDIQKCGTLNIVEFDSLLYLIAKEHAVKMGESGMVGHSGKSSDNMKNRMPLISSRYKYFSESCQYGYNKGLYVVLDLLIDDGVADLGHRKSLLRPDFNKIGLYMCLHKIYTINTVLEMAVERK